MSSRQVNVENVAVQISFIGVNQKIDQNHH
jgi:hypothetical protein